MTIHRSIIKNFIITFSSPLKNSSIWKKPSQMSRKILLFFTDWISQVSRQKINTELTHEFLKRKPPSFFQIFQFHIRQYSTNSPSFSKFTLDYHRSSLTQNQLYSKIREKHHMDNPLSHTMIINYPRKRPEIVKVTVSWKRFNNRIEGDFEEESLFEDLITSTCVMFSIWSLVCYNICNF